MRVILAKYTRLSNIDIPSSSAAGVDCTGSAVGDLLDGLLICAPSLHSTTSAALVCGDCLTGGESIVETRCRDDGPDWPCPELDDESCDVVKGADEAIACEPNNPLSSPVAACFGDDRGFGDTRWSPDDDWLEGRPASWPASPNNPADPRPEMTPIEVLELVVDRPVSVRGDSRVSSRCSAIPSSSSSPSSLASNWS